MPDRGFGGEWRTVPGELLCPRLLSDEQVEEMRIELQQTDPGGADAQLEQNPKKYSGDIFKIDRLIRVKRAEISGLKFDRLVRFWDRAATQDGGCFTAGMLMARRGEDLFFLHVAHGQWSVTNVYSQMKSCAALDVMNYGAENYEIKIERESGSGGKESAENAVKELPTYNVEVIAPWTNKEARAQPMANRIALCNVYVVEEDWTPEFLEEFRKFPGGPYKDRVDASSGGYMSLFGTGAPTKRAIVSSAGKVTLCETPGCGRPAAAESRYCCGACEIVAAFEDPSMKCEHDGKCSERAYNYRPRRI